VVTFVRSLLGSITIGNQVWLEFLLPTMAEAAAILDAMEHSSPPRNHHSVTSLKTAAGTARKRSKKRGSNKAAAAATPPHSGAGRSEGEVESRKLLSLLWAMTMPCCESLGGDDMWLFDQVRRSGSGSGVYRGGHGCAHSPTSSLTTDWAARCQWRLCVIRYVQRGDTCCRVCRTCRRRYTSRRTSKCSLSICGGCCG
jgi:hypothetical protein